jgi:hypothetical protein
MKGTACQLLAKKLTDSWGVPNPQKNICFAFYKVFEFSQAIWQDYSVSQLFFLQMFKAFQLNFSVFQQVFLRFKASCHLSSTLHFQNLKPYDQTLDQI